MSIVSLDKITLYGQVQDKAAVLEGLQQLGRMHLIPLQPPPKEPEARPPEKAENAYKALQYLTDVRVRRHQLRSASDFDFNNVMQQALANKQQRREIEDKRDFLLQRIEQLTPWGNFNLPDHVDELAGYHLWFYRVPHNQLAQLEKLDLPWQRVHHDPRFAFIVVIAKTEPPADALPVPRTHTGALSLETLRRQLDAVEIELEDLQAEHQALSRWIFLLSQNLAHAEDQASLKHAGTQTLEQDGILVVQGWLAKRDIPRIEAFAEDHGMALMATLPDPDEIPPTLMDNPPALDGGQDLVSFYETPGYRTWDPSIAVFFSFALFFAMILADAGYSLLLAAIVAYYWKRMGDSKTGRRFRVLAAWVLGASFIYGVLVGSYFGISPPQDSLLGAAKLLELNDFDSMMHLSIFIGCLHLGFANAMVAYQAGRFPANAQPLGWIAVIFGGLFLWLGSGESGPVILRDLGIVLLMGGVTLVGFFASRRKVDSIKTALLRVLDGLGALTNVTKMFGDVLSYLRLFALGLASASLAITFNKLAVQVHDAMPGLGLLLSILVLLLGHGINLGLGIVSGFVHGLRLNFIEFFNWGISDEGYPFRAFEKKEITQ